MRLDARALATATGIVAAASFAVCAFFVAVAPAATSAFFSYVMHVDLTGLARHITWGSFFGGLLIFSLLMALHVGLAGWLYNVLSGREQPSG